MNIDVVCAARQARAQRVDVVRTAAVVELSVVGVHVRLYGVLLQQIGYVLGVSDEAVDVVDERLQALA